MRLTKKAIGDRCEARARRYLEREGLIHVASNFRCRRGEIDLIMRDREQLVFIEVRYRGRGCYGTAADTVTGKKQKNIILAAEYYLYRHRLTETVSCRFDTVAIDATTQCRDHCGTTDSHRDDHNDDDSHRQITWLKDAFNAHW